VERPSKFLVRDHLNGMDSLLSVFRRHSVVYAPKCPRRVVVCGLALHEHGANAVFLEFMRAERRRQSCGLVLVRLDIDDDAPFSRFQ
jgi:hypothetical protein